jgi:hypothetical protein
VSTDLRRELALGGLVAIPLALSMAVSRNLQVLAFSLVLMLLLGIRAWRKNHRERIRPRLASTLFGGTAGLAIGSLGGFQIGVPAAIAGVAVVVIVASVVARARLRATALPAQGEPAVRVAFGGRLHAVGKEEKLPGFGQMVAVWVAQQGKRRWHSQGRLELRGERRRVLVEPKGARLLTERRDLDGRWARDVAAELDGADPEAPIRLWNLSDGALVYAIGRVELQADAAAPALRDPEPVPVFVGDVLLGIGYHALKVQALTYRIVTWTAMAATGGALAVLG